MGRHRNTGIPRAQQAALLATGAVTSHRRVRNTPRARSASVLAVGVLATGAVLTATNMSWFQEVALPQSRAATPARPDEHAGTPPGSGAPTSGSPAAAAPVGLSSAPEAPTASPTAEPAPSPTLWRADQPAAFRSTPWNSVGAAPPRVEGRQVSVRLSGRNQRSELEPHLPAVQEGDQHDVTFWLRLGLDFPVHDSRRQVIARWENDGPGPAPLELRVRDGQLVLHGGEGHPTGWRILDRPLGAVPTGQWCQLGLRVCFSANAGDATVSVWRDGEPVLTDHHPAGGTLYPGQQSYLKVGLHRDAAVAQPAEVHLRDLQVARTRATSQPDRRAVSSGSTSVRRSTEAITSSHVISAPRQRSSSSAASSGSAASPHRSTKQEAAAQKSTAQKSTVHKSTVQKSTEHRSASSSGTSSQHGVPRNTPSHVSTAKVTSRGTAEHHGGSSGSRR
jgi:polysaccharide lyase-like protein